MARTIRFIVVLVLLVLYVVPFWGNFSGRQWPGPVRSYAGCAVRTALTEWQRYCQHAGVGGGNAVLQHRVVWLAVSVILGVVVPVVLMACLRRRPADVGLGLPNRWGRRMILVGVGIVMLMAVVFAFERRAKPDPIGRAIGAQEGLIMIGVSVPEHVLLTGVALALLLSGMRLPQGEKSKSQKVKKSKGNPENGAPGLLRDRVLCWLGLGLPAKAGDSAGRRMLAWWGLEPEGWWAIVGGGLLFGIVHFGARPIEFMTSFPGGLLLCYVTYRSRSIWPGWCVHVVQMALVMGLLTVFGGASR